jgi:hypothetical protein
VVGEETTLIHSTPPPTSSLSLKGIRLLSSFSYDWVEREQREEEKRLEVGGGSREEEEGRKTRGVDVEE